MSARVEIIAYAPTEFYHCQHCEFVWSYVGFGSRWHADQRQDLLPPELRAEYAAISEWAGQALERYGDRLSVKVVDAASIEGVWKALRYGARRFPSFVIDGRERILGFDREQLDAAVARRVAEGGKVTWITRS